MMMRVCGSCSNVIACVESRLIRDNRDIPSGFAKCVFAFFVKHCASSTCEIRKLTLNRYFDLFLLMHELLDIPQSPPRWAITNFLRTRSLMQSIFCRSLQACDVQRCRSFGFQITVPLAVPRVFEVRNKHQLYLRMEFLAIVWNQDAANVAP